MVDESTKAAERRLELEKAIRDVKKEALDDGEAALSQAEAELRARGRISDAIQKELTTATRRLDATEDEIEKLEEKLRLHGELGETEQKALENAKEILVKRKEELAIAVRRSKEAEKIKEAEDKVKAAQDEIKGATADILTKTLGVGDAWKDVTFVGKLFKGREAGISFAQSLALMGQEMEKMLSTTNILGSAFTRVYTSTLAMVISTDSALAGFNRATGFAGKFNEEIAEASAASAKFGASMSDTGAAATGLAQSMSSFTTVTPQARSEMISLAAGLEKVGIGAEVSGKMMDDAMKGWGMSREEAQQMTLDLVATADALGYVGGASKYAQDFNSAMKELSKYGAAGADVFKELAITSKAAGVEMDTLMSIAGKFDTIEGAASAAGELNAILGGNLLNSMELLNATEAERITMLQQAVRESGKNWKSMDRFEKQAVASAAGISSMAEANKMFSMSQGAYSDAASSIDGVTGSHDSLTNATQASVTLGEKWAIILERLAVMVLPLVNAITWVLELITEFGAVGSWVFFFILPFAIKGLMALLLPLFGSITTFLGSVFPALVTTTTTSLTAAAAPVAGSITVIGAAATKVLPGLLGIAAAFLGIGIGIGMLIGSIALLINSVKGLTGGEFVMLSFILIALGIGLYFLIPALLSFGATSAAVAMPILLLGLAFLALGAGVFLAGLGLYMVALAMIMIGENVGAVLWASLAIVALAIALAILIIPLALFGVVAAAVAIPILVLGAALILLGLGAVLVATALYIAALSLILIGENVHFVALAIVALAGGIALLTVVLPAFTIAVAAFGIVAAAAGIPIVILGAGFFLLGLGIALVGAGLYMVAAAMVLMGKSAGAALVGTLALAIGLALLIIPLALFGVVAAFVAIPIAGLGSAFLFLGLGMILVGTGLYLAALAIGLLVEHAGAVALLGLALIPLAIGLAILLIPLALVGIVAAFVAIPLLALGLAFLVMGAGAWLAGLGVKLIAEGVLLLVGHVGALFMIILALGLLVGIAIVLAYVGWAAFAGLAIIAAGLGLIALALWAIPTDDLVALGNMMIGLGAAAENLDKLASVAGHIKEITSALMEWTGLVFIVYMLTDAMDDLAASLATIGFATFWIDREAIDSLADMFDALAVMAPAVVAPGVVEAVEKIVEVADEVEPRKVGGFFDLISNVLGGARGAGTPGTPAAGAGGAATPTGVGNTTIILQINEREFGRAVTKALNENNNLVLS